MSKRAADPIDEAEGVLKQGERPLNGTADGDDVQFEDDFEDEFESEDEIMEAGVDGRPDDEREAEQARGVCCLYLR